jgi:hypothetical protein
MIDETARLRARHFLAKLNIVHSNFCDDEFHRLFERSFGFNARPLQGRWVVFISRIERIKPGDIISTIDGQDFNGFFQTPLRMGVLEVYQNVGPHPDLRWSAPVMTPAEVHYNGRVLILTDVRCFSACEDFVEPFKVNSTRYWLWRDR